MRIFKKADLIRGSLVIVLLVFSYASHAASLVACPKEHGDETNALTAYVYGLDKAVKAGLVLDKDGGEKARAALEKAKEVRDKATEDLEKADVALDNADAVADQTFPSYKMAAEVYQELKTHDNISTADYKELITDWKQKEAAYNEAEAALERAIEDLEKADAALKKAHTDYDKAKAALNNLQTGGDAHVLSLLTEYEKADIKLENCQKALEVQAEKCSKLDCRKCGRIEDYENSKDWSDCLDDCRLDCINQGIAEQGFSRIGPIP